MSTAVSRSISSAQKPIALFHILTPRSFRVLFSLFFVFSFQHIIQSSSGGGVFLSLSFLFFLYSSLFVVVFFFFFFISIVPRFSFLRAGRQRYRSDCGVFFCCWIGRKKKRRGTGRLPISFLCVSEIFISMVMWRGTTTRQRAGACALERASVAPSIK